VVFDSDVTSSPDTALTSCKSVTRPVGVGGGGLSRPTMRFRRWIKRCNGPRGIVGGGSGAMGDEGLGAGTGTGSLVGTVGRTGGDTGRLVGRIGTTGDRLEVGGIVNEVGSNEGALDGLRVGRRVGLRVGRAVIANRRVVVSTTTELAGDGITAGATMRTWLFPPWLGIGSRFVATKDSGCLDCDIVSTTPSLRPITNTRGSKPI
jgi:hypothetical protein